MPPLSVIIAVTLALVIVAVIARVWCGRQLRTPPQKRNAAHPTPAAPIIQPKMSAEAGGIKTKVTEAVRSASPQKLKALQQALQASPTRHLRLAQSV